MSKVTEQLTSILEAKTGAPFLFVGSGFSKRYMGLEKWSELLEKFCDGIKAYGYYTSQNNNYLPGVASSMAVDFNAFWWSDERFAESREEYKNSTTEIASSLKIEIAKYVSSLIELEGLSPELLEELAALSALDLDGVITTNWDLLLEELFPDYRVFVGQEELLFSNPQSVAEIYKIHGCSSQPNSLVLTREDYQDFENRNPYLAAKLITLFIEHPIIFIGYSISDENIQKIIKSIVNCLGQEKLEEFASNLIFVQRTKDGTGNAQVQQTIMAIGEIQLGITVVRTDSFIEIYNAIANKKRKIPAKILRFCKEQMYDLVKSANPEQRMIVSDIDNVDDKDKVEFVMGVGVAAHERERLAGTGYQGVGIDEIFLDSIKEESNYDAEQILARTIPNMKSSNKYVPIYRYLREIGINSLSDLRSSEHASLEKFVRNTRQDFVYLTYQKQYSLEFAGLSTSEIIAKTTVKKAPMIIPFQQDQDIDRAEVRAFLDTHKEHMLAGKSSAGTYFRKLACLLDYIDYSF
nr:SIR2 family protein [uncultured Halomonas sp.]